MDRSRAEAIVEAHLPGLIERFGLGHWEISVDYGPRDNPRHTADCGRNLNYNRAWIGFNPEKYHDEATLVEDVRHELFHVVLAPFDLFCHLAMVGMDGERLETINRAFEFAVEQSIIGIERVHRGVTKPAARPKKK